MPNPLRYTFFRWLLLLPVAGRGQVYPGDVNADGRVDQYDLPYLGYAFGSFGPARPDDGSVFGPQNLLLTWSRSFPNDGPNFAHADCNGDGQVNLVDFLLIHANFGQSTPTADSLFLPAGVPGLDPPLALEAPAVIYAAPGQSLSLPLLLGDTGDTVAFNGLAFSLRFPPDELQVSIDFSGSWIADSSTLSLVRTDKPAGELAVGLTRFGSDQLVGNGPVAAVNFIVEGDLIGLLQTPDDSLKLHVDLEEVMLANGDFQFEGVVPGSICIVVKHPDALTNIPEPVSPPRIRVFPNPATQAVWVDSEAPLRRAEWISALGQTAGVLPLEGSRSPLRLNRPGPGLYILRLTTADKQTSLHKIIFH